MPRGQRALFDSDMCALIDQVFMSGGAIELPLISSSFARDLHWTSRLQRCFAGTGHQHVLDIRSKSVTWDLLDHLHVCIFHDVLITPFWEWNLLCCVAVIWHCVSGHCISVGTSTLMYCCCETSVICCTFWPILLMYCTCLVTLHTESGESCSLLWMNGFFLSTIFMMIWNGFAGS